MISVCAICGTEPIYFEPWAAHLKRVPQISEINLLMTGEWAPPLISQLTWSIYTDNQYNFSEWRNKSLEMANKEWILVLDIDEFLSYEFIEELPSLLEKDCDFIQARRMDFWDKDNYRDDLKHKKYYLFKNPKYNPGKEVFYTRALHEVLCVRHGNNVEDVHPVHLIEDWLKIAYAKSPVYHYSFIKRQKESTDRIALYKTIRYLNDWNINGLNDFSREELANHIKSESEKGAVLKKFESKHPKELEGII